MSELPYAVERLIGLVAADSAEVFWATIAGEPARWNGLEAAWRKLAVQVTASITETLGHLEVPCEHGAIGEAVKESLAARMLVLIDRTGRGTGAA